MLYYIGYLFTSDLLTNLFKNLLNFYIILLSCMNIKNWQNNMIDIGFVCNVFL